MDVLISGMGIAGPTLAWWLRRGGHRPVIVEEADQLRTGGYIIDFWGLGYDIADRMGIIPRLRDVGYFAEEIRFVDEEGHRSGGFSADVFKRATNGRYVSLPRSELSAVIVDAIRDDVDIIWGDSIVAIDQQDDRARVQFRNAPARSFDVVVGADGLHSNVRRLCFGEQATYERYLGYQVAAFETQGYPHRDENVYVSFSKPGLQVDRFSLRDDGTLFMLVLHDADSSMPTHADPQLSKALLHKRFDGLGWETPEVLKAMDSASQLYFDRVSQIRMERWWNGRVCLVGDAAAAPSLLAGEGSGLAMIEAYVLAGELCKAAPGVALPAYQAQVKPFIDRKQNSAEKFASSFAPKTQFGVTVRDIVSRAFGIPFVADLFLGGSLKDDFRLPDYDWPARP
ncbi:MAG: FAD-binding domain [Hyphomonadaceae bacterium]